MYGRIIFWGILGLVLLIVYKKAEKTIKLMDIEDKRSEAEEIIAEEPELEKTEIEEEK